MARDGRGIWSRRLGRGRSRHLGDPPSPWRSRDSGDPVNSPRASTRRRARATVDKNSARTTERPKAREDRAEADGDEEVGSPHKSQEAGKRVAPEPVEQRRV